MKTISELNEKIWYRFIKVLYIGVFCFSLFLGIVLTFDSLDDVFSTERLNLTESSIINNIIKGIDENKKEQLKEIVSQSNNKKDCVRNLVCLSGHTKKCPIFKVCNILDMNKEDLNLAFFYNIINKIIIGENVTTIKNDYGEMLNSENIFINEYIDYVYSFSEQIISENNKVQQKNEENSKNDFFQIISFGLLIIIFFIPMLYLIFFKLLNRIFYYIILGTYNPKK